MTTTNPTTLAALEEYATVINSAGETGQALGISPCDMLRQTFPAVADDDDVLSALAQLLDPMIEAVNMMQPLGDPEGFVHGVWHIVQLAAALGHSVGVHNAIGALDYSVPEDLANVDWDDLPDVFGESGDS
jgi:hypothetical protein